MRGLLLASVASVASVALAADIDVQAVANPAAIRLGDRSAQVRFEDLFAPDPDWVSRQIAYLTSTAPKEAPTLLTARLLYRGEPWSRRDAAINPRRWRLADREVRLAVLREMRLSRQAVYAPAVRHLLTFETDPALVASAVDTLAVLDLPSVVPAAVALADPRRTDHLPGSDLPAVRQRALEVLLAAGGVEDASARDALAWALTQARSSERNHAISLLKRGEAPDLLSAAIIRFAAEQKAGELDDDGSAGLALACVRLGSQIDAPLARALVGIAVSGPREIAAPAATALAGNVTWMASVPVADIAERAAKDPDPVIRHALSNLLLRVNAKAGADTTSGTPWSRLAEHRARLERWAWDEYVK